MSRLGSYSRTLDEIFAMSAPKPRQSTNGSNGTSTTGSKESSRSPIAALGDRPTTRHGRSSESSSSSNKTESNKPENNENSRSRVDVWTREDSTEKVAGQLDSAELIRALGSKRRNIADSPIMENELSEISSNSSDASTSNNEVKPFNQNRSLKTTPSSNPTTAESFKLQSIHTATSSSSNSRDSEKTGSRRSSLKMASVNGSTESREESDEADLQQELDDVGSVVSRRSSIGSHRDSTGFKRGSVQSRRDSVGSRRSSTGSKASKQSLTKVEAITVPNGVTVRSDSGKGQRKLGSAINQVEVAQSGRVNGLPSNRPTTFTKDNTSVQILKGNVINDKVSSLNKYYSSSSRK
ncbi:unnamed protein product [Bursaphelenchus okinawaensis]|uniref:Uncharacterized protein n=1 Tax=Bursaphelenchus okinawaensis TaxID=465554 RepID=A0A811KY88_9BILA|nr:unnamed protein product [Bursaphelenchus okinawaensis]CAG9112962.1 unnamed protein product [Bursaphelenchus okinawaensis]